jgi:hypothetical protein
MFHYFSEVVMTWFKIVDGSITDKIAEHCYLPPMVYSRGYWTVRGYEFCNPEQKFKTEQEAINYLKSRGYVSSAQILRGNRKRI